MHAEELIAGADGVAAKLAVDRIISDMCDERVDVSASVTERERHILEKVQTVVDERARVANRIASLAGQSALRIREEWPVLTTRIFVYEPPRPLSNRALASIGYAWFALLTTASTAESDVRNAVDEYDPPVGSARSQQRTPTTESQSGGSYPTLAVWEQDRGIRDQRLRQRLRQGDDSRTPIETRRVYDCFASTTDVAPSSAHKYASALSAIDNRTGITKIVPGGWLEALRRGMYDELLTEMKRTWSNPNTYLHKISSMIGAMNHCESALGFDAHEYASAREFLEEEHRAAKAVAYDNNLDNRLTKQREQRIVSDTLLDTAIARAGKKLARHRKNDADGLRLQLEKLWLLIARHVPAKRSDWGQCAVFDTDPGQAGPGDESFNYVIVPRRGRGRATLVLERYKTSKVYGEFREEMPKVVSEEMRLSLKRFPRNYLFVDPAGCSESGDSADLLPFIKRPNYDRFARWVKDVSVKYLGVGATINDFRRRSIKKLADPGTRTRRERSETARSMMHSLNSQDVYRFVSTKKGKRKSTSKKSRA